MKQPRARRNASNTAGTKRARTRPMPQMTRCARRLRWVFASVLVTPACARAPAPGGPEQGVSAPRPAPPRPQSRPGAGRTPRGPRTATRAMTPDVPYEPSPNHVVSEIISLAALGSGDVLYDLGCGDGRIVIAAVKTPGVRGVCIDIDPVRIAESRDNARTAGVSELIEFRTEDLFQADIGAATVVTLFLWPEVNLRLRPKLERELRPGTRVISYMHDFGDWLPERAVAVRAQSGRQSAVYLWTIDGTSAETIPTSHSRVRAASGSKPPSGERP